MSDSLPTTLLPNGLHDVLPPEAAHEAAAIERLMRELAGNGYERVKPPLLEFEASLFSGSGEAMADHSFRLMDPVSQRMLAVRADITPQIARIARSRLSHAARPLRLCYAGQVLRVKGSQLRPERQFAQVGAELIGALEPEADAEVILLATQAAEVVGIKRPTVDLCLPTMVKAVCDAFGVKGEAVPGLRDALDRKDAAAVKAIGGPAAALLEKLMQASGPADRALKALDGVSLPEAAERERTRLRDTMALIRKAKPDLTATVDLVEHRGFEYQTGLSFTLFARGVQGEIGSGGRYRAGGHEPATGFTLYMDTVLGAVPAPVAPKRLYLPHGTAWGAAEALRKDGWVTVGGLTQVADADAEARRLRCGFVLENGAARALA
jgi:ATP phosphoribosyltransferase regulatory subunit